MFLGATLLGLYSFGTYTTSELAERTKPDYSHLLAYEMTAFYTALLLLPALLWFMNRFPIERGNWRRRLPAHIGVTIVFGASHTLLMWGSRTLLFQLLGWGTFDYGRIGVRFLMEYQKQLIMYWFLYSVVALVSSMRKAREREVQASQLERQLAEARLNTLKMQLNPHFLFNTLNMISSYVYEDARTADRMIASLSDLLRLTLSQADRQEVALDKELEFLDAYLAIMKARFQENLQIKLEVEPATRDCLVPSLLLQPLVENFVKHCMTDFSKPGSIGISSVLNGDFVRLEVKDNGPGMAADVESATKEGVGLSNTRQRLQQLYGADHRFEMNNVPAVDFALPWKSRCGDRRGRSPLQYESPCSHRG